MVKRQMKPKVGPRQRCRAGQDAAHGPVPGRLAAHQWQFTIYRASHDDYDESILPAGLPVGTCQQALDTACGLYLNDPTAWT